MNLGATTFKRDWALGHSWYVDQCRGQLGQTCELKFIDIRRHWRAGLVHLLSQRAGDQIPNEHLGFLDISQGVFVAIATEPDDGGDIVKAIEKAIRR